MTYKQFRMSKLATQFEQPFEDYFWDPSELSDEGDWDNPSFDTNKQYYKDMFKVHKRVFNDILKNPTDDFTVPEPSLFNKRIQNLEIGTVDPGNKSYSYRPYKQWTRDVLAALKAKDADQLDRLFRIIAYRGDAV